MDRQDCPADIKDIARSRIDTIFQPSTWAQIRAHVRKISRFGEEINSLLRKANFFRYRNMSAHGRQISTNRDVIAQADLMYLTFQVLLLEAAKQKSYLNILNNMKYIENEAESAQPAVINIWD